MAGGRRCMVEPGGPMFRMLLEERGKKARKVEERPRLDAPAWALEKIGFAADPAQARILRSSSRRVILNCTRQWGKSTVTAAKAVHEAVTRAESLIVVVSPCARQSGEFVRKASGFVRRLGMRL